MTPPMIVAVTIRADRYEPLHTAPQLDPVRPLLFPDLKPMPPAGYAEVITGPARRATQAGQRLTVEPALVERLLAETAEGTDALPLLALTLERLFHDFGDSAELTVDQYESMGGMAQVVQTEVDKLLAADPEQRRADLDSSTESSHRCLRAAAFVRLHGSRSGSGRGGGRERQRTGAATGCADLDVGACGGGSNWV